MSTALQRPMTPPWAVTDRSGFREAAATSAPSTKSAAHVLLDELLQVGKATFGFVLNLPLIIAQSLLSAAAVVSIPLMPFFLLLGAFLPMLFFGVVIVAIGSIFAAFGLA